MRKRIINILYNNKLNIFLYLFHVFIGRSKFFVNKNCSINYSNSVLYKNMFVLNQGAENRITIDEDSFISNCVFKIKGSNNKITIGSNGFMNGVNITIEGDNNTILIGKHFFVLNNTTIIVVDGSCLSIGDNCMFSDNIDIRTTDNHSIIDRDTKKRINPEKDVVIGDNVWIGTRVNILKGVYIANGCIVGAGSIVTHKHKDVNSIIAGNPARLIKENIEWKMERI